MELKRIAGIDIGSNGVRLLIMNVYKWNNEIIFNKTVLVRAPIRLGDDSFSKKVISKENQEMLKEAMVSFASLMKCYKVAKFRACATSAFREASNQDETLKYIYDSSNIQIEVIDGQEEAELLYSTQIQHLINDSNPYLFIDVGGGSTELTYYINKKKHLSRSFKIGSVRLLNNLVEQAEWDEMKEYIISLNLPKETKAMGTGGNINTVFKYSNKPLGKFLSKHYLKNLYTEMDGLSIDERIVKYGFNPDRADVIIPALAIYINVMNMSKINEIYVPKIGLADGLVRSLVKNSDFN